MIAIGFAAFRSGYFPREINTAISKVVVKLTLPLLIISSLTKVQLTRERLINSAFLLAAAAIVIFLLFLVGGFIGRRLSLPKKTLLLHQSMTALGNVGFLGYPLMLALYGEEGLFYAALYGFVNDFFVWTYIVYRLSAEGTALSGRAALKNMLNPPTIAFVAALLMLAFGIRPAGIFEELISGFGSTTTCLSMLFIGGVLAGASLRKMLHCLPALCIILVKMLLVPIAVTLIVRTLPFNPVAKGALVMQIAVPCQTILSVLTSEYGGDTEFVAKGIFVTTIAGLATMPFIYYIFSLLTQGM